MRANDLQKAEVMQPAAPESGDAEKRLSLHVPHFTVSSRLSTQAHLCAQNGWFPPAEQQLSKNPAQRDT